MYVKFANPCILKDLKSYMRSRNQARCDWTARISQEITAPLSKDRQRPAIATRGRGEASKLATPIARDFYQNDTRSVEIRD